METEASPNLYHMIVLWDLAGDLFYYLKIIFPIMQHMMPLIVRIILKVSKLRYFGAWSHQQSAVE